MVIVKPLYRYIWRLLKDEVTLYKQYNSQHPQEDQHQDQENNNEMILQLTRTLLLIRGDIPMALHLRYVDTIIITALHHMHPTHNHNNNRIIPCIQLHTKHTNKILLSFKHTHAHTHTHTQPLLPQGRRY